MSCHERGFVKRRKRSDFPRSEAMGVLSRLDILPFLPPGLSSYSTESATLDGQKGQPANQLFAHERWSPARLGRSRYWTFSNKGRELDDPPGIRMGKSGLAPLDPLLQ